MGIPDPPRRVATVLESVEEIRALVGRPGMTLREPTTFREPTTIRETSPLATPTPSPAADDTQPFRPAQRPSMAVLCVLDDGDDDGEAIRIRTDVFVIGRVEGDLVIPHDSGISGRHAEISRRLEGGLYRWYLKDLQSTNGTFVRASSGVLHHQQEILLGGRRYRFEAAAAVAAEGATPPATTRKWQAVDPAEAAGPGHPWLVELNVGGAGKRFPLAGAEHCAGRDPRQCSIVLDHPMISPRHARFHRDDRGRWHVQNAKSLNGLWLRVQEIPLERGGQFQCGEQRFAIRVL
jgi:pSer/pThr/pTyr-binding forkhead associated (FHA) protein